MPKVARPINRIQPLQMDTVIMTPKSYIRGEIGTVVNVKGNALAAKVELTRKVGVSLPSGHYRLEVTEVGATGTGKFKIYDIEHGTESADIATSADVVSGFIAGVDIKLADTTGTVLGDYVEFQVDGDQTFIIAGTVVGRFKAGHQHAGKWSPAYDDTADLFDAFRITNGFVETDKTQTLAPNLSEVNLSENYATSVIVYGCLIKSAIVNLTPTLEAKLNGIVWE